MPHSHKKSGNFLCLKNHPRNVATFSEQFRQSFALDELLVKFLIPFSVSASTLSSTRTLKEVLRLDLLERQRN
jgi:hypothetical protein